MNFSAPFRFISRFTHQFKVKPPHKVKIKVPCQNAHRVLKPTAKIRALNLAVPDNVASLSSRLPQDLQRIETTIRKSCSSLTSAELKARDTEFARDLKQADHIEILRRRHVAEQILAYQHGHLHDRFEPKTDRWVLPEIEEQRARFAADLERRKWEEKLQRFIVWSQIQDHHRRERENLIQERQRREEEEDRLVAAFATLNINDDEDKEHALWVPKEDAVVVPMPPKEVPMETAQVSIGAKQTPVKPTKVSGVEPMKVEQPDIKLAPAVTATNEAAGNRPDQLDQRMVEPEVIQPNPELKIAKPQVAAGDRVVDLDLEFLEKHIGSIPQPYDEMVRTLVDECYGFERNPRKWNAKTLKEIKSISEGIEMGPDWKLEESGLEYKDHLQKTARACRERSFTVLEESFKAWEIIMSLLVQRGLHPKDLLLDKPVFGGFNYRDYVFEDDEWVIDNRRIDDLYAGKHLSRNLELSYAPLLEIPSDDKLGIEKFLEDLEKDQMLLPFQSAVTTDMHDLRLNLEEKGKDWSRENNPAYQSVVEALRGAGLCLKGERDDEEAFDAWLQGLDMGSDTEEEIARIIRKLLSWRYPRSSRLGWTTALGPLVPHDKESDSYTDSDSDAE